MYGIFLVFVLSCSGIIYSNDLDNLANAFKNISEQRISEEDQAKLNQSLLQAIHKGTTSIHKSTTLKVASLIKKGANINIQNKDGQTPLMYSIIRCSPDLTKLLIEKGANINIQNKQGQTPLMFSIARDYPDLTKLLIEKGAQLDLQDDDYGKTALLVAIDWLGFTEDILKTAKYLIEHGTNLELRDKNGKTALMNTIARGYLEHDYLELAQYLIDKGARLDIKDNNDSTLLHAAIRTGNSSDEKLNEEQLNLIRYFIDKGLDVNAKDKDGQTPLFYAVKKYNYTGSNAEYFLNIIRMLLAHNAAFKIGDNTYQLASLYPTVKALFDDIVAYKAAVEKNKLYAGNNALEETILKNRTGEPAFNQYPWQKLGILTKYEWLTLALLNNHIPQIKQCIKQGIFTPFEILKGLALRPYMPLTIFDSLWEQVDKDEKNKLENVAQEAKNQNFLDAITKYNLAQKDFVKPDIKIFYN